MDINIKISHAKVMSWCARSQDKKVIKKRINKK